MGRLDLASASSVGVEGGAGEMCLRMRICVLSRHVAARALAHALRTHTALAEGLSPHSG